MIHDILVTVGIFSILSLILGWQADALFLTAVLTVIGFSVQDTIVVFDRIRENTPKYRGESFTQIADRSLTETMHRSLATQLCAHVYYRVPVDLRRRDDQAVCRRDVHRPDQRHLLLALQRRADPGRLGRQGPVGSEGRQDTDLRNQKQVTSNEQSIHGLLVTR